MALLALVSLFGSTVGWIVVSSEGSLSGSKNGLFPKFFAKTNKKVVLQNHYLLQM